MSVVTAPVASTERMDVLDVVRGVAVFGILVVNIYAAGVLTFYGIGLGTFGSVSLATALAGCVVFFGLQMIASRRWLSIALFGPAEWLWRTFTYRRRFALFR